MYSTKGISYGFPKEYLFEYKEMLAIERMRSCIAASCLEPLNPFVPLDLLC